MSNYEVTQDLKLQAAVSSGGFLSSLVKVSFAAAAVATAYKIAVPNSQGLASFATSALTALTSEIAVKAVVGLVALYVFYLIIAALTKTTYEGPTKLYPRATAKDDFYDVAIVGAGPSGCTTAFYLVRDLKAKVLLLEKKKFPRDKYCGDAVPATAHPHLKAMGVLDEILKERKGHPADNGGMISPNGLSFIGRSADQVGKHVVIGIRRKIMDEKVARATQKAGADLRENHEVVGAKFDKETGLWTVECKPWAGEDKEWAVDGTSEKNESNEIRTFKARMLVCADGATSTLARSLGIVTTAPDGVCSRAYVEGDSHNFKADGVVFYPKKLLPGYCSVFRVGADKHDLSFCCYIIPGNPKVTNDDLPAMHHDIVKNDPFVSRALGPNAKMERMKAASLRLGGVPKSFGPHLILTGDAAGFIDPLTGEGIHLAMMGGKLAADRIAAAIESGDYSERMMSKYQDAWMDQFGNDFKWSYKGARMLYRFPLFLDASCAMIQKKGPAMLGEWAQVMTCQKPKSYFLKPSIAIPLGLEVISQCFKQAIFGTAK
mmetsp:Transcript_1088/g.2068  ORF Transcript_1088/g.2068 Transcript_1088/m.2068 type:complete len:546 (-) Transcript_1088:478-2115(-)